MLIVNSFLERTIGWETGCDVYALLGAISGMGQAITNAAIAFDRYRFVARARAREHVSAIFTAYISLNSLYRLLLDNHGGRLRAR